MITIRKLFVFFIASLFHCLTADGQREMVTPLHSNPVIKQYLKEHSKTPASNARIGIVNDTLQLPFIDDFSYDGVYPNPVLWSDSDVFINRDFPINPPSLGVATFDGLNKYGNPYYPGSTTDSIADHLTSNYINLNFPTDTTIWLSFFYEPEGRSYSQPYTQDSLMLEFENSSNSASGTVNVSDSLVTWTGGDLFVTAGNAWNGATITINSIPYQVSMVTGTNSLILSTSIGTLTDVNYSITYSAWNEIWSIPGSTDSILVDSVFQQVMIQVDTPYLNGAFRFRFTNIANLGGADDQWNVDYLRLDKNRSLTDTGFTNEGAFLYRNRSLLVWPYTSMPYSHFKTNPGQFVVKSDTVLYKNLDSAVYNFANYFVVTSNSDTVYKDTANAIDVNPYSTAENIKDLYVSLPVTPDTSLTFTTWNINKTKDSYPQNDTVRETQTLSNYYSYDDGTAEAAYGLYGASTYSQSMLAIRFDMKMQDTLRGVQIYWDQIPANPNPHNLLVNLAVWNQLTPNTNNSNLIYQLVDALPQNDSTINGFVTYLFEDTLLVLNGTIYVGWIQNEIDLVDIGFDFNTDTHSLVYYNVADLWQQSEIAGSIMLRPIFGSALPIPVNVHEITKPDFSASAFPNPATGIINISINSIHPSSYSFQLFDAIGELVRQQKETTMDVSNLDDGFYLLKITDDKTSQFVTRKILVSH